MSNFPHDMALKPTEALLCQLLLYESAAMSPRINKGQKKDLNLFHQKLHHYMCHHTAM